MKQYFTFILMAFSIAVLSGCTDEQQKEADMLANVNAKLENKLQKNIGALESRVKNTSLRGKYEMILSTALAQVEKEHWNDEAIKDLVKTFRNDMTVQGTPFKTVKDDVNDVLGHKMSQYSTLTPSIKAPKDKLPDLRNYNLELERALEIVKPSVFDERYIDYINALSAISDKVDPIVVNDNNRDAAFASQFVGNPAYGQWVTDSNGGSSWSFWETYGMISFIDDLFFDGGRHYGSYGYGSYRSNYNTYKPYSYGSNRYRYDTWHNQRNYSYYNDVYSKKYENSKTKATMANTDKKLQAKYSSNLSRSTVASRQNATLSRDPKTAKFSSNLASKPRVSKTQSAIKSSIRSSGSSGSRSGGSRAGGGK
jgi:hypothetical protein